MTARKKYTGPDRRKMVDRLDRHERECASRYSVIEANTEAIGKRLTTLESALSVNTSTTNRIWWAVLGGGGSIIVFLAKLAFG